MGWVQDLYILAEQTLPSVDTPSDFQMSKVQCVLCWLPKLQSHIFSFNVCVCVFVSVTCFDCFCQMAMATSNLFVVHRCFFVRVESVAELRTLNWASFAVVSAVVKNVLTLPKYLWCECRLLQRHVVSRRLS
ncbi:unnamed protein product [Ixodes pacificus]